MSPYPCLSRRRSLLVSLLAPVVAHATAPREVRLARPWLHVDPENWYALFLLEAALEASGEPGKVRVLERMTNARGLIELSTPEGQLDVVVGMASKERDEKLMRVPVPLYKGLFGLRVMVVRRGETESWRSVRSLESLRQKLLLQGQDWPDTRILNANGLQVRTAAQVPDLYDMLLRGEGDAFPRSVTEAPSEVVWQKNRVEVVPNLMLRYHTDLFFYVRRGDTALAQQLERGLLALNRSGALDRLLLKHHAGDLRTAALQSRAVIELAMVDDVHHGAKPSPKLWTPPRPR